MINKQLIEKLRQLKVMPVIKTRSLLEEVCR